MKLSNWKILYRILACFALLSVIVAGGVWFATSRMQAIDQLYTGILEKDVRGVQAGMRANQRVFEFRPLDLADGRGDRDVDDQEDERGDRGQSEEIHGQH